MSLPPDITRFRKAAGDSVLVGLVVFLAAMFGILTRPIGFLASLWPANAILLGMMVRQPRFNRVSSWIAAALGYVAADLATGGSLAITLWLSAGNLVFAFTGTRWFARLEEEDRRLLRPPSVLYLFAISLAAALMAAAVGSGAGKALFQKPLLDNFNFWASTELVNAIVILPVLLTAPSGRAEWRAYLDRFRVRFSAWKEILPLLSVAVSVIAGLLVGGPGAIAFPVPSLLWCALSYRLFTSAIITMSVCVWMMIAISSGILQVPLTEDFMTSMTSVRLGITLLALAPLTVASVNTTRNRLLEGERQATEALKAARDEAKAAEEAKSLFLAMMSHEIRTPLNGIVGMVDLLEETRLDAGQTEMTRVIQRSSSNLLSIINDVLDFSKIEAGKLPITEAPFNLRRMLEDSVALVAPAAERSKLDLVLNVGNGLDRFFVGDEGRIRQVLGNLLSNAIKFTRDGGVTVNATRTGQEPTKTDIRIEVRDTGIGIPESARERLFQPFVQAEDDVASHFGGSGLGLSISEQLLKLMNGSIGFQSRPGEGSVFWFQLPLKEADPENPEPGSDRTEAKWAGAPLQNRRVLVVDDNEVNRLVACRLVSSLGCEAESAAGGDEALVLLSKKPFDLILLDCRMPSPDGYETAKRIRSGEVGGLDPGIPIIALTASASPAERSKCFAAGMDDFMCKPVSLEGMKSMLGKGTTSPRPLVAHVGDPGESVDFSVLHGLDSLPGRSGGTSLRDDVVDLFLATFPGEMQCLREFIQVRDASSLSAQCHRMAGSCATAGARRLRILLRGIEESALAGSWETGDARLQELDQSWSKTKKLLQRSHATSTL